MEGMMDLVAKLRSWHLVNAGNGINGEFFGKVADELERLQRDLDFERSTNDFDAKRLRRLATLVGRSVPESDETLLACAGTVLGGVALNVERVFKDFKIAQEGIHSLMLERDAERERCAKLVQKYVLAGRVAAMVLTKIRSGESV